MFIEDEWGELTRASYKKAAEKYKSCWVDKEDWQLKERRHFAEIIWKNSARFPFLQLLYQTRRILDLGCGDGKDLPIFWSHGLDPVGLDYAEEMLEIARRRCPKALLVLADMRKPLFFADEQFWGVWISSTIAHIPRVELRGLFREIRRVLKKDGVLYVTTRRGEPGRYRIPYLDIEVYRARYTVEELTDILDDLSFQIISAETIPWKFDSYPTIFAVKKAVSE